MKTKYRIIETEKGKFIVQYKFKYLFFYGAWYGTSGYGSLEEAQKTLSWFVQRDAERREDKIKYKFKVVQEEIETES